MNQKSEQRMFVGEVMVAIDSITDFKALNFEGAGWQLRIRFWSSSKDKRKSVGSHCTTKPLSYSSLF